jgi:hypothetical protein
MTGGLIELAVALACWFAIAEGSAAQPSSSVMRDARTHGGQPADSALAALRDVPAVSGQSADSALAALRDVPAVSGQPADSALEALRDAARLRRYVRVFHADSATEGRVVSLGQQQFRVGSRRLHAAQVDSVFVRRQEGASGYAVAAGAGTGVLVALLAGALVSALRDTPGRQGPWAGAGAVIGGFTVMAWSGGGTETWVRVWPP